MTSPNITNTGTADWNCAHGFPHKQCGSCYDQEKPPFSLMDITPFHPDDIRRAAEDKQRCLMQIERIGK